MPSRTRMNNDLQPPVNPLGDFMARLSEFIADFGPTDAQWPDPSTADTHVSKPEPEPGLIPHPVEPEPEPVREPVVASVRPERVQCLCVAHADDPWRRYSPEFETYIETRQKSMASHGSLTASAHADEAYAAWQGAAILDEFDQAQAQEILDYLDEG